MASLDVRSQKWGCLTGMRSSGPWSGADDTGTSAGDLTSGVSPIGVKVVVGPGGSLVIRAW